MELPAEPRRTDWCQRAPRLHQWWSAVHYRNVLIPVPGWRERSPCSRDLEAPHLTVKLGGSQWESNDW